MGIPRRYSKWTLEGNYEPIVPLADIKEICYIDTDITDDDAMLTAMEVAASNLCSSFIGYPLLNSSRTMYVDIDYVNQSCTQFVKQFTLKGASEVLGIAIKKEDGSVVLYDPANVPDIYVVSESSEHIKTLRVIDTSIFNTPLYPLDSFQIVMRGGFGETATTVPEELKLGIKLLVANWYEHREDQKVGQTITSSAKALWSTYRLERV